MKKKRPIADRKYKEVRSFITKVFDGKYGLTIFDKDIILDDGSVIIFIQNNKRKAGNYTSYFPIIKINNIEYICARGNIEEISTADLHRIYKTIHNSLDSILFQVYL